MEQADGLTLIVTMKIIGLTLALVLPFVVLGWFVIYRTPKRGLWEPDERNEDPEEGVPK